MGQRRDRKAEKQRASGETEIKARKEILTEEDTEKTDTHIDGQTYRQRDGRIEKRRERKRERQLCRLCVNK